MSVPTGPVAGMAGPLVTVGAWLAARAATRRLAQPWLSPVALAVAAVVALVAAGVVPGGFAAYRRDTAGLSTLLEPATTALAWPLVRYGPEVARRWRAFAPAFAVGAGLAVLLPAGLGWLCRLPRPLQATALPLEATSPIAMAVAARLGGDPHLAAVLVIGGAMWGAAVAPWLRRTLGVPPGPASGAMLGIAASAIGTAAAFAEDEAAGAAASVGMVWTGLVVLGAAALLGPALGARG
ncbi:MAG: LrgB family protein [Actinomycetia bacterium]|nr:LrgB family protein [Actinomycetes bacterium]